MFEESENHFEDGGFAEEINKFEQMIKTGGSSFFDMDVLEELSDYYISADNLDLALKAVEEGLIQYPHSTSLKLKKAQLISGLGATTEAHKLLDDVESMEYSNSDFHITRAAIFSLEKKHELAISSIKTALTYCDSDSDTRLELFLDLGYEYQHLGKFETAIFFLKKGLELDPTDKTILYEVAYCYEQLKMDQNCARFYQRYLDVAPYSSTGWYNLGNALCKTEEFAKAVDAYDFAVLIDGKFSSAHFNKGNAHVNLEQYESAITCYYESFVDCDPQAITFCYIGECYEKLERYEEAQQSYSQAIELDKSLSDAWIGLGVTNDAIGVPKLALEQLRKGLELEPDRPEFNHLYANCLEKNKELRKAKTYYEIGLKNDPENANLWLDYANLEHQLEDIHKAISIINQACDRLPADHTLHFKYASYLIHAGQNQKAINELQLALNLNPKGCHELLEYHPEVVDHADVYFMLKPFIE